MLLSNTEYIAKLSRIFKNVPLEKIKYAVNRFTDEKKQNDYLRKLNNKQLTKH